MSSVITNFTKRFCSSKWAASLFGSILFIGVTMCACREGNLELGENLIPANQMVTTLIDSSIRVNTYIVGGDTLATNRCGAYYWGAATNGLGSVRAEFAAQFAVGKIADSLFGRQVSVDSLTLTFGVDSFFGSVDTQSMTIYTLNRRLFADSVYYSDFDVAELKKDSLTEVELVAGRSEYTYKIYDASVVAGVHIAEFVESLIDTSGNIYRASDAFYGRFPGLFFGRLSGQSGALYRFGAKQMKLSLYYKNRYTSSDTSLKVDYHFTEGGSSENSGASHIEFDYGATGFESKIGNMNEQSAICPVQSLGGLKSRIVINRQEVTELIGHFARQGYDNVVIVDAKLNLYLESATDSAYSQAVTPIGLFERFRCYDSTYRYIAGIDVSTSVELNRTQGVYSMDITSLLNRMLREDGHNEEIIIAPQPQINLYGVSQTMFQGTGSSREPKLKLTIALIGEGDN